jgi:hypothetical protein
LAVEDEDAKDYEVTLTWDTEVRQHWSPGLTELYEGDTVSFKTGAADFQITFTEGSPFPGVTTVSDSTRRKVYHFQPERGTAPDRLEFHCELDNFRGGSNMVNPTPRKI